MGWDGLDEIKIIESNIIQFLIGCEYRETLDDDFLKLFFMLFSIDSDVFVK